MEDIPIGLRLSLEDRFGRHVTSFSPESKSEGDNAQKVLFRSKKDDVRVEAVSLRFQTHRSLCISSQAGCAFQCAFCATGKVGLKRQLDADEVSDQVLYFLQKQQKIDGVSLMGMGEPLANPRIFDAIRVLTHSSLFSFSSRRLNVSTVGVVPGILKLTEDFPQVNLAFSLHSPFTEERNRLVPLNRMYPMAQVFDVLDQRIRRTGRRVWVAYLLLQGQNDSLDHAKALASLIRSRPMETRYLYHVNLLPYNVGKNVPNRYSRTGEAEIETFQQVLQQAGISSSYRNSFGHGIDAACGQLFAGYEASNRGAGPPPLVRPASSAALSPASSKRRDSEVQA
eukprot:CAMPEP_0169294334 /NCGR_PEP_ID=MMETSP1016-20121227/63849_1 /TAXON_ID=342587 /ORGANISM="Karlodinium micrum, Strain CCMP2283" /LENGTH=338 /DNA_ID=CAMNT_0009385247 /DNA_START=141 /DNA_END=1153 /DNA_ORIENTATION=+